MGSCGFLTCLDARRFRFFRDMRLTYGTRPLAGHFNGFVRERVRATSV
jgi:hypothetical protein